VDNRVLESNYEFKPLVDPSIFGDDQPKVRFKKPPTKSTPKRVPKNLKPVSTSSQSSSVELAGLEEGARISHNRFGAGTIVSIEGNGGDAKALIDFDANGRKNLLLRFAKLNIL
jgi:DNA helicase-2/ATP-dependent DNA helicase PcrA